MSMPIGQPHQLLIAGPAEIIRAAQKDTDFIKKLQEDLNEAIQIIMGQKVLKKWRDWPHSIYIPTAIYYALTNLAGFQTLGEEYGGILQVQQNRRNIPSKKALSMMILLTTIGQPILEYVMKLLEGNLAKQRSIEEMANAGRPARRLEKLSSIDPNPDDLDLEELEEPFSWIATGHATLRIFRHYLPFLNQLHLAVFYLNGAFFHFSKRLTGIHYILVRKWYSSGDARSRRDLKYLMWMSIINSMLTAVNDSVTFVQSRREYWETKEEQPEPKYIYSTGQWSSDIKENSNEDSSEQQLAESCRKCSLCLEVRKQTSVTPCGHLFCWSCIIDWLRTKQECPVCREQFEPSRIVPLRNYK